MRKLSLGLIAHDSMKEDMVRLIKAHAASIKDIDLIATRDTGRFIQEKTNLAVTLMQSGPEGGDQQIGALIANGEIDALIFLRDPLTAHPHEPDVSSLLKVCDVHKVPLATNIAAAEAVVHLIFEHPEALSGHHLAAQLLEDMAAVHD